MKRRTLIHLLLALFAVGLTSDMIGIAVEHKGNIPEWDANSGGRYRPPPGPRHPIYGYMRLSMILVICIGGMTACVLALRIIPKYAPGYLDKPYGHTEEDDEKETSDVSAKDR